MRKTTSHVPLVWKHQPPRILPAQRKALVAKRDAWLQQIDPASLFHTLFDVIPGVRFFAKNRQGELMFLGQSKRELFGLADESDVIGMTDFDLNPTDMAQAYVQDDELIFTTGKPLLNRVELGFDRLGMPDWFVVNKVPIRSRTGEIIGVMGFSQSYEGRAKLLQPFHDISKAVSYLRDNYQQDIAIRDLARQTGLSPRQLERKFKAAFGASPQQFLIKTRLLAACRALRETGRTLSEIAFDCGFSDQSAFARHFRRHVGMTPSQFRQSEAAA